MKLGFWNTTDLRGTRQGKASKKNQLGSARTDSLHAHQLANQSMQLCAYVGFPVCNCCILWYVLLLEWPAALWLHCTVQPSVRHLYALQLRSPIVFISSLQAASLGGEGGFMEASSTAVV
jgi:hypothetical protein